MFKSVIWKRGRLVLLAVAVGLAWWLGGPLVEDVDIHAVRSQLEAAGPLGAVAFLGAFAVGNLLSIPGLVFVVGALLAYGKVMGFGIALVGSLVALSLNFAVVRGIGGSHAPKAPTRVLRWGLERLEHAPVSTVAMLRATTVLAPPVNYALALSSVRYRDYMVGSTLGLVAPLLAYALGVDCLIESGWVG